MNHSTTPAVVLSGNLGTPSGRLSMNEPALALTRSLGRRGVRVYRFHPDRSLADLWSRYCTHVTCPNLYDDPDGLVEELVAFAEARPGVRPVLYPASDGAALFIAEQQDALRGHFHLTSPSAECITEVQNKRRLLETAAEVGVPVPDTHFPTDPSELPAIAESLDYPVVVKPLFSTDWKRGEITAVFGKVKAMQVGSADELLEKCRTLLHLSSTFMIQEIVPGPDDNLLTFLGYLDADGEALAGCVRKKLRQYPPGFGYCCLTESVHDDEIFELSVRLLNALDYHGIAGVEFKRDPATGVPKLIEINTRAVRTSGLALGAGVDFPWVAYQDLTDPGHATPSVVAEVPVRWWHVRDELAAAGLLMVRRQLSPFSWLRGFVGKKLVAGDFAWDDTYPALLFWGEVPKRLLGAVLGSGSRPTQPPPSPKRIAAPD